MYYSIILSSSSCALWRKNNHKEQQTSFKVYFITVFNLYMHYGKIQKYCYINIFCIVNLIMSYNLCPISVISHEIWLIYLCFRENLIRLLCMILWITHKFYNSLISLHCMKFTIYVSYIDPIEFKLSLLYVCRS